MYAGRSTKRRVNPRENASFLNYIWFIYTWAVFKIGIRREVQEDDVFEVMEIFRSEKVGDKLEREWQEELRKPTQSIVRALIRAFGKEYFCIGLFTCTLHVSFMLIRPISISKIVKYFAEGQTSITLQETYWYAILLLTTKPLYELMRHNAALFMDHVSLKLKASLCSLVYRKSLRVNEVTTSDVSIGHIMTMIAKDVNVFEVAVYYFHDLWIGFIELIIMTCIMYRAIGESTFVGIGYLLLNMPVVFYVGFLTARARFKASGRTDERLRIMQEIFATIKLIKIYTWDKYFTRLGVNARKKEMNTLRFLSMLKSVVVSLTFVSGRFSFYLCMMYYIYKNNNLTSETAYLILNCYDTIRFVLGFSVPENVSRIGEASSCLRRIKTFLLASEIPTMQQQDNKPEKVYVELKDVNVGRLRGKIQILKNINLKCRDGLIGVTGPVGSGKSTLFKTILNDVLVSRGEVSTSGSMSYASQEPWIFPGSIRQNILFGEEFNEKRYNMVLRVCALERDINNWTSGDNFLVIDRGLNISRGQQARINLARAIYRDADIYLLDDSLSALDSIVSEHIFNLCIAEFLLDKLVVLVTHNTRYLENCAGVVYVTNGSVIHKGRLKELEELLGGVQFGDSVDSGNPQKNPNEDRARSEKHIEQMEFGATAEDSKLLDNTIDATQIYQENQKQGKVDASIYKLYLTLMGGWKYITPIAIVFVGCEFSYTYWDYFVSEWVDLEQNRTNYIERNLTNTAEFVALQPSLAFARTICTIIVIVAVVLNIILSLGYYTMTTNASRRIHTKSFNRIMGATMEFFDKNLPGTVLNRFSKDLNVVDERVPSCVFDIACVTGALAGTVVNIILSNVLFLIPTVVIGIAMYFVRHFYLRTGRCLHRLTGITRAPVIGHLTASLNGLTTIKASGKQQILRYQFDRHQDLYTSAYYMHVTTLRSFLYYMDCLCDVYICVIIFTFLGISTDSMAGKVGLGITQSFAMTGVLQWAIRQTSNMEINMTSCERVLEYASLKQEDLLGKSITNWPSDGSKLEYSDVNMCYANSTEPVLKNISFVAHPKERIGVIGRTGAGKSSLLSALFRLYRISGRITIDGIDISEVGLKELRSRISVIPQEPVLYAGTLRSNLDPYKLYTDAQLWQVIKEVDLTSVEDLDCTVRHGGSNFSIGQRQLICLARVILQNNKLLVLDEATANVDPHTNDLMQKTINRVFADCTMLIIAHRLNIVLECDKVMVIDNGAMVEFGATNELMKNRNGVFYNLVVNSGVHIKSE